MSTTRTKAKGAYQPPALPSRGEAGLTRQDIAALLRVSTRTLDLMVGTRKYPPCDFRLPDPETGDPRWLIATHDGWVRSRLRGRKDVPGVE